MNWYFNTQCFFQVPSSYFFTILFKVRISFYAPYT